MLGEACEDPARLQAEGMHSVFGAAGEAVEGVSVPDLCGFGGAIGEEGGVGGFVVQS